MVKELIQIEAVSAEGFKNEIVKAVIAEVKLILLNNEVIDNSNEMISRNEAAKMLMISSVKLWQLTKDNIIPKYTVGRKVLYKKSDIKNFLTSCVNV